MRHIAAHAENARYPLAWQRALAHNGSTMQPTSTSYLQLTPYRRSRLAALRALILDCLSHAQDDAVIYDQYATMSDAYLVDASMALAIHLMYANSMADCADVIPMLARQAL